MLYPLSYGRKLLKLSDLSPIRKENPLISTVFFTVRTVKDLKSAKTWEKTRAQFLLRHKSGAYYARVHAAGKEHWIPLETSLFEVAKARLLKAGEIVKFAASEVQSEGPTNPKQA